MDVVDYYIIPISLCQIKTPGKFLTFKKEAVKMKSIGNYSWAAEGQPP